MHYVACRGSMHRKTTSLTVLPVSKSKSAIFAQNCSHRDHSYITSTKDWVGGSRKLLVLLTFTVQYCIYSDLTP